MLSFSILGRVEHSKHDFWSRHCSNASIKDINGRYKGSMVEHQQLRNGAVLGP